MNPGVTILLGLGAILGLLTGFGIAGVSLTGALAIGVSLVVAGVAALGGRFVARHRPPNAALPTDSPLSGGSPWRGRLTPAEGVLLAAIVLIVGVAAWRAAFYPVSAMDAHAYDGRARWIVAEQTLDLSIYDTPGLDGRSNLTYPPGYPLSLALVYWFGGTEGKIIDIAWLVALLLVLFDFVSRRSTRLIGLVGVFLLVAAPEFWRHASLGLTNLATTAAIGAATLLATDRQSAWRPALLFGLATLLRIDSVVLALAVALFLALRWRSARMLLMAVPALAVALGWQLTLKARLGMDSTSALRASWAPDWKLLTDATAAAFGALSRQELYGWCVAVFAFGLLVSIRRWRRLPEDVRTLLLLVLVQFLAILVLYQQIDPAFGGGGGSYFANSLKRALFVLMPGGVAAGLLAFAARPIDDPRP